MVRWLLILAFFMTSEQLVDCQATQTLTLAPESSRWDLEGEANPSEYLG